MRRRFPFAVVRAGTGEESRRRGIRLVTAALMGTALLAFVIVGSVAVLVAKRIARDDALAEATRSAQNTADVLFAPVMPQVLANSRSAISKLDAAVAQRRKSGLIFRVKVWNRAGTVVYSDDRKAIGRQFPLDDEVRASIDRGASSADISDLSAPENVTEAGQAHQLVEVYTPLVLADGQRLAFEIYSSDARVRATEHTLITKIVPFALLSLLVLVIVQLPVRYGWYAGCRAAAPNEPPCSAGYSPSQKTNDAASPTTCTTASYKTSPASATPWTPSPNGSAASAASYGLSAAAVRRRLLRVHHARCRGAAVQSPGW